jgi:hypothetical protein
LISTDYGTSDAVHQSGALAIPHSVHAYHVRDSA